jgi:GNAT superfamily N-acetyltransferase
MNPKASNQPTIRLLQQEDIEVLSDLYFPWSTREDTLEKWSRYLEEQTKRIRTVCIVAQESKIMGYGNLLLHSEYLHFRNNNTPEINDIWIYEENRKKGIATSLIAHLEQLARQQGYAQIGIGVGLYQDYGPAQRLYFQLGYIPDGNGITYKAQPTVPGQTYPLDDDLILWLVKAL